MKYIHYIAFVTTITGDQRHFDSVKSNNKIISHTELLKCITDSMKTKEEFRFGILDISTVVDK